MKSVLKVLIVDDEKQAASLLKMMVEEIKGFEVAGIADSVDRAIKLLGSEAVDIVLLDIRMPGKDGFRLVEFIKDAGIMPAIVFVSAYKDYALKAIKASAFDYLLKPVRKEELTATLFRFRDERSEKNLNDYLHAISSTLEANQKIKFPDHKGFFLLHPDEILYFEAEGNYTYVNTISGKPSCISKNIGIIENTLPRSFVRISRKHMINLRYLDRVNYKDNSLRLNGKTMPDLKISRNRRAMLEVRLQEAKHWAIK